MGTYYVLNEDHTTRRTDNIMDWGRRDRRVALDKLDGDVEVSTVFLGIDHAWGGGEPILFESMVFGGPHSDWQDRYHTWAEAEAGHRRIVENLRAGLSPDGEPVSTLDGGQ